MKPTKQLHDLGQSLWLDNITRGILDDGTLEGYIRELDVTGLTSNPTIFDKAITGGNDYDEQITELREQGLEAEQLFFELALADLRRAADLFKPVHIETDTVDGFVSLEVSPKLAYDTEATIKQAAELHGRGERDNLFIKIPGTPEGLPAIEESIFAGIPINVTLLFSSDHYLAAADAYMKGIERRIAAGLDPDVRSVASLFMSRWDVAVADQVPAELKNRLGIAVGKRAYKAYRELLDSERMQKLESEGARPQRLLWASTGTKDPEAPDTLYIEAFAAPDTINTMPEKTLLAFADHGKVGEPLPADGGDAEQVLAQFADAGVDVDELAARLQEEGADAFVKSWEDLIELDLARGREAGELGRWPGSKPALRGRPAWKQLERHYGEIAERHLRELFADDPGRGERLIAEGAGLFLDYSKNRITDETLRLLIAARGRVRRGPSGATRCSRGEHINVSEDRAVLHVALRMPRERSLVVDGERRRQAGPRGARPDERVRGPGPRRASGAATPASRSAT